MTTTSHPLTRKLIASLSAAALGLGLILGSGAPVRANSDDVAKVIAGAAALAIIGTAINKAERDDDRDRDRRAQGYAHGWHQNAPQRAHGWQHREPPRHARPNGRHVQDCVRTRHGQVVCGRDAGQVRAHPGDRRGNGWDNDRRRHDRDRRHDRPRDHRRH